jgi:RNA polymerase sigma-70 factor (ECF subfamily)
MPEPVPTAAAVGDPAATAEQRESVSLAFLTLLERLTPEQRVVYVLREALGLPYDEIAEYVGKNAAACRQIFRRAHLRLAEEQRPSLAPVDEHRQLIERFIATVQTGDAARIATLLAEDVVLVGDGGPNRTAARRPVIGIDHVSRGLAGYVSKGWDELRRLSLAYIDVNGAPAVVVHDNGRVDQVYAIDVRDGKITAVRGMINLDKLRYLERALFG